MGVPKILDKRKDVIGTCRHDGLRGVPLIDEFEKVFFSSAFMANSKMLRESLAEPVHAHEHDR